MYAQMESGEFFTYNETKGSVKQGNMFPYWFPRFDMVPCRAETWNVSAV